MIPIVVEQKHAGRNSQACYISDIEDCPLNDSTPPSKLCCGELRLACFCYYYDINAPKSEYECLKNIFTSTMSTQTRSSMHYDQNDKKKLNHFMLKDREMNNI
ncbi:hypothetical protein Hanom_Chr16g01522221 [Helianthus anomalus]